MAETCAKAQFDAPGVCLAIPAFIASLGSITDPLNCNRDCAYTNEFTSRLKTSTWEQWGPFLKRQQVSMREHNFGWRVFWDSNPDWVCLKFRLAAKFRNWGEVAMPGKSLGRALSLRLYPGTCITTEEKRTENTSIRVVVFLCTGVLISP